LSFRGASTRVSEPLLNREQFLEAENQSRLQRRRLNTQSPVSSRTRSQTQNFTRDAFARARATNVTSREASEHLRKVKREQNDEN
jgi:hypothetical protein